MPAAPELGLCARAVVDRVIDGDTLDVELRLPVRVRLLDCWAPEVHGAEKPDGIRAKLELQELLPRGARVVVHVPTRQAHELSDVFTFGRILGNVWRTNDEKSVSERMVELGFATAEKVKHE